MLLACLLASLTAAEPAELVTNGDFAVLAAGQPLPAGWIAVASDGGQETFTVEADRDGGSCIKVAVVERARSWGPGIGQLGIAVTGDKWYRVRFRARQRGIDYGRIIVALRDTRDWSDNLLWTGCEVGAAWEGFTVEFQAGRDLDGQWSRFQFSFDGQGTLWLDDVSLVAIPPPPPPPPANLVSTAGRPNRVPNGSFEAGLCGWATTTCDTLMASLDRTTATHGETSLRIDLGPETFPHYVNDYTYTLGGTPSTQVVRSLPLTPLGWLPVESRQPYTLSVDLRSEPAGVAVKLRVVGFNVAPQETTVRATAEWARYRMSVTPLQEAVCVEIDPVLPEGVERLALWVDGVGLAPGDEASFAPAFPVEVGIETDHPGNWYHLGETLAPAAVLCNGAPRAVEAELGWWVEDFFGRRAAEGSQHVALAAGEARRVALDTGLTEPGFYRLHTRLAGDGWEQTRHDRLALVFPYAATYPGADSQFGLNHPFVGDAFMTIAEDLGITWVRYWGDKWNDVEPEQGDWRFAETDAQLARLDRLGCHVLLCLATPSSGWASTAPAGITETTGGEAEARRNWWLPRSWDDYEAYVTAVVRRYRDRTDQWEVFNEPSDRKGGPDSNLDLARNYVRFVDRVRQVVRREDPNGKVLGAGLYYLKDQADLGAVLRGIDLLSEHRYPGLQYPLDFQAGFDDAVATLRREGSPAGIWVTEYGVYADDDPDPSTVGSRFMVQHGTQSERRAATRVVQQLVAGMSAGVEKVFFHIGNWLFRANFEHGCGFHPFFEYGGVPRKTGQVLNVLAWHLPPGTRSAARLSATPELAAYEFAAPEATVFVLWSANGAALAAEPRTALRGDGVTLRDVTGATVHELSELGDSPVYVRVTSPISAERVRLLLHQRAETAAN